MTKNAIIVTALSCALLAPFARAGATLASYQSTIIGQSPSAYFTFDNGSLASVSGSSVTLTATASVGNQFIYDVFGNPSNCVFFTLQGDTAYDPNEAGDHLINGGGTASTNSSSAGSFTCLFRSVDPGPPSGSTTSPGQKFIFSAGGSPDPTNANALQLYFENPNSTNGNPGALKLAFGDNTSVLLTASNVIPDCWYYFGLVYNESAVTNGQPNTNKATWYLGRVGGAGVLTSGVTSNITSAVAGNGTDFFIGTQNNGKSTLCKPGDGRVDEFALWNRQLSAAEVQAQFANLPNAAVPPVSAYQTVISNQSPAHYFPLLGSTADVLHAGTYLLTNATVDTLVTNPLTGANMLSCGLCPDYFLEPAGAAYFAFGSDAIYTNSNLLNGGGSNNGTLGTGRGSVSGMFHGLPCTNYYTGQKFILSAGGSTTNTNGLALFLETTTNANPFTLKYRFGDSTGVVISNVLSSWYYFTITYDETATNQQARWWVGIPGGTLQSGFFSAGYGSRAGAGSAFYIGNDVTDSTGFRYQNSSHTGNGQVSQVAIWNSLLSSNQVATQFNALTAQAVLTTLTIQAQGSNVIISWPASAGSHTLQSTPSLSSPNWTSAGAATLVGTNYLVTNSTGSASQFYRLTQ